MKHVFYYQPDRRLLLVFCFCLLSFLGVAQDRKISGKIISAVDQKPLPGVNVVIKGTQTGSSTNADGEFSVGIPASRDLKTTVLVFSAIGYQSQEVTIGNQTQITLALTETSQNLNEVVVTALGIKKEAKRLGYARPTSAPSRFRPTGPLTS